MDRGDQGIIMLSAKQGGGKSTLANKLKQHLGSAEILKFADVLYEIHDAVWNVLDQYEIIPREKKSSDLLQWIGTEFGRKRHSDMWVLATQARAEKLKKQGAAYLIIDDCRFENEFWAFNCPKIRLECERDIRKQRTEAWREDEVHDSEIGLDSYAAKGKFDLYLDTGAQDSEVIFERVLNFLDSDTTDDKKGDFYSNQFRDKFYHELDLSVLPALKKENKDAGKNAYGILNKMKAGHIPKNIAEQQISQILMGPF